MALAPRRALAGIVGLVLVCGNGGHTLEAQDKVPLRVSREALAQQRAVVARKPPGGQPAAESATVANRLLQSFRERARADKTRPPARQSTDSPQAKAQASKGGLGPPPPDPCTTPQIKTFSAGLPLDPGDEVLVQGCGFGPKNVGSELRLMGDFPGGHITLAVKAWTSSSIAATVPAVTGVKDDANAKLQVVLKSSKISNWETAGFRATRAVTLLRPWDVIFHCVAYLSQNICDLATQHPLADSQFFGGATIAARYVAPFLTYPGEDTCQDIGFLSGGVSNVSDVVDVVSLKNGWVLAGYAWWWRYEITLNWGRVDEPLGFKEEASANIEVKSMVPFDSCTKPPSRGGVSYRVDLYAIGPVGVPYK